MKTTLLSLLITILTFFNTALGQIQEWQDVSPFPGAGRDGSVSFTIGETAYVGLGVIYDTYSTYQDDFYKYDVQNDEWTPIADFPGAARASAVAFVSNNKAYVGTGYDSDNSFADFYEYDPATNSWRPIASIPEARRSASCFTIDNTGYVGLGSGSSSQLSDFYKYDVALDQWTPITGVGAGKERVGAIGFAANGKGYISSGQRFDGGTFVYQDILSYDPNSDTWVEELDYNINLSSLMSNTAYVDEDGLVHVLKSSSSNSEVIINLSDFSVRSDDYYFTDDRDDPIVFYINNEVIAGLGATGSIFDPVYQTSFQKLVTIIIEPPLAPTILRTYDSRDSNEEFTVVNWINNEEDDFDSNIIYLSNGDNSSYRTIGTNDSHRTSFKIYNYLLDPNTVHYVKVAANRKGVRTESDELSFYPIFREGKITAPKILSIKSSERVDKKALEVVNFDLRESVILERSLDDDTFEVIDSLGTISNQDTTTISFTDSYDTTPSKIKYRIRLYDRDSIRENSAYSNEVELDINSLLPSVTDFSFDSFEQSSYFTQVNFTYEKIMNRQHSILEYKNVNDTVFTNSDTLGFSYPSFRSYDEIDTVEARLIVSNQFGADTSSTVNFVTPLFYPNSLERKYSSIQALGFDFDNDSRIETGTIVERSENGGDFLVHDTIFNEFSYFDEHVAAGNDYTYRLYNYRDDAKSIKSEPITLISQNMSVWKQFNGDGLYKELDSIAKYSMEYKLIEGGNIFFLSSKNQKFYRYNIDSLILEKLPDFPDPAVSYIEYPKMEAGVIYCFGARNDNFEGIDTIYQYNSSKNEWENSLVIPFENYEIRYAEFIEDKIYLIMRSDLGQYSIGSYDKTSMKWDKTDYDLYNPYPNYVTQNSDSLIILDVNNGRISYHFQTKEISSNRSLYDYESRIEEIGIVNYQDELLYLGGNSIKKIDLNDSTVSTFKEYLPVVQDGGRGYAFEYGEKLFYGLATDYRTTYSSEGFVYKDTDLLYYKDIDAPLEPTNLRVDSLGITGARISWIDSPNETEYYIEITKYDSVYVSDTLAQNQIYFEVDSLEQHSYHNVKLIALKNGNIGKAAEFGFRTKRGRPYRPKNFESEAVSSSEILYTWDPIDTTEIPVDSLVFIDYNADKYVLNISDTSFLYAGLDENSTPSVDLYVKNIYGSESAWWSNRARTFLNSPFIKNVEIHQTEEYYDLIFEDRSRYENYYIVYRKSASDTAYVKLDSISTSAFTISEENLHFEDKKADISMNYEYYLVAEYKGVNEFSDTTIYYSRVSLPSDAASTENAVLSVNPYLDKYISIYPNPSDQEVFIKVERDVRIERIEVLNVNGGIMKVFERNLVYNISDLKDGLYFVKIYTNQGATTKKIVKQ